jgi:hypothetical protein
MKPTLRFKKHQFADTVLLHDFPFEFKELKEALSGTDIPLNSSSPFTTSSPKVPKRQRKQKNGKKFFQMFPVNQSEWNKNLRNSLKNFDWHPEPIADGSIAGKKAKSGLKGDFVKNGVFVEVEFGNIASAYRDLFKFLVSHDNGQARVGVLVTATRRLASLMDQGVADFESVQKNIFPYLRITPMPILFIGLDYQDSDEHILRHKYDEMYSVATSNGVQCHPSEVFFGNSSDIEETEDSEGDQSDDSVETMTPNTDIPRQSGFSRTTFPIL